MKKKTTLDQIFDFALILAPFIYLTNLTPGLKALLLFYVVYLPYLIYYFYMSFKIMPEIKEITSRPKVYVKKAELDLVS